MGEHNSTLVTPRSTSVFSRPAKLPSRIMARCGYVWLPIGSPSGAALSREAPAARNPATAIVSPALVKNSRLDMKLITFSSCHHVTMKGELPVGEHQHAEFLVIVKRRSHLRPLPLRPCPVVMVHPVEVGAPARAGLRRDVLQRSEQRERDEEFSAPP